MSQRQRFRITDFSGGLNPDQHPLDIQPNQAQEILNFRLDKVGSLTTRRGWTELIEGGHSSTIQAIGRWTDGTDQSVVSQVLIKDSDGEIHRANWGAETFNELLTGLSGSGADAGVFTSGQNILTYTNPTDGVVQYDGTEFKEVGIEAPVAAPNLVVTSGDLDPGSYQVAYTYYDSTTQSESNPSPVGDIGLMDPTGIRVDFVAPTDSRVTHYRIYRTVTEGVILLRAAEVDVSAVNYTLTSSDTLTLEAQFDNNLPPVNFERMAYVKGYWFGSRGNTIYWSKPFNVDAWPFDQNTQVPFEGNDVITALVPYQDTLLVFGRTNLVLVAGSGGLFSLIRQDTDLGTINQQTVTDVDGTLIFLSYQGLRTFPNYQVVAPQIDRVLAAGNFVDTRDSSVLHVPQERAVWVADRDRTYTIHLPTQAVSAYTITGVRWLEGGRNGIAFPLFVPFDSGDILQYGGETDGGNPIVFRWISKVFSLDNPEHVKAFRRIGAWATIGSEATVTVTIADEMAEHVVPLQAVGDFSEIFWDQFNWDEANWTSESAGYFIAALPANTLLGRTLEIRVAGEADTFSQLIAPISLEYRESDRFLGV